MNKVKSTTTVENTEGTIDIIWSCHDNEGYSIDVVEGSVTVAEFNFIDNSKAAHNLSAAWGEMLRETFITDIAAFDALLDRARIIDHVPDESDIQHLTEIYTRINDFFGNQPEMDPLDAHRLNNDIPIWAKVVKSAAERQV